MIGDRDLLPHDTEESCGRLVTRKSYMGKLSSFSGKKKEYPCNFQ